MFDATCQDCNYRYTMYGDNHAEVRANVAISKGDELTDYYVSPLHGSNFRRRSLAGGWFFLCTCNRCQGNN